MAMPLSTVSTKTRNQINPTLTQKVHQTYGLSNPPLRFSSNQRGLTILNIGNVTTPDVWWNISSEGGLLLVGNRHIEGTLAQFTPGESITAKLGFMLRLGKMTFHLQAGASNVETLYKYMTGILVLFIIL